MRDPSDRLVPLPAVQLLSTQIPIRDDVVHVANEDGVVRQVEEAGALLYDQVRRLVLQRKESRGPDCREAHEAPDQSCVGRRLMRQEIAQQRQPHACRPYEQHPASLTKVGGQQHDHDVEHCDGDIQRRERIDDENGERERASDHGKNRRPGKCRGQRSILHFAGRNDHFDSY